MSDSGITSENAVGKFIRLGKLASWGSFRPGTHNMTMTTTLPHPPCCDANETDKLIYEIKAGLETLEEQCMS
jgi:hypothetical protein